MYYELIINKNVSSILKENEEYNKNEVITVFHSMVQKNASTKYPFYHLYEEPFHKFATDITKISKIINHKFEDIIPDPPFMEDDKKILVKPKTKTTSITEMFNKINKTNEL
jgi:hypothetical protein